AERARDHAVAAPVADVLLDHDRPELGAEERARRAHVETCRPRAVLAHIRAHQPAEPAVQRGLDARVLDQTLQRSLLHERVRRRPGLTSHVAAFTSWMCTFESSASGNRSLAGSPVLMPRWPQW